MRALGDRELPRRWLGTPEVMTVIRARHAPRLSDGVPMAEELLGRTSRNMQTPTVARFFRCWRQRFDLQLSAGVAKSVLFVLIVRMHDKIH